MRELACLLVECAGPARRPVLTGANCLHQMPGFKPGRLHACLSGEALRFRASPPIVDSLRHLCPCMSSLSVRAIAVCACTHRPPLRKPRAPSRTGSYGIGCCIETWSCVRAKLSTRNCFEISMTRLQWEHSHTCELQSHAHGSSLCQAGGAGRRFHACWGILDIACTASALPPHQPSQASADCVPALVASCGLRRAGCAEHVLHGWAWTAVLWDRCGTVSFSVPRPYPRPARGPRARHIAGELVSWRGPPAAIQKIKYILRKGFLQPLSSTTVARYQIQYR